MWIKNKIDSLKSWWYWNICSKYDSSDYMLFVFLPIMLIMMGGLAFAAVAERREIAVACEAKGGYLISTHKRYVCLDKNVVIHDL